MLVSVVSSFVVVKTRLGDLESDLREVSTKLAALDTRLDKNDTSTNLVGQRLDVLSGMNSPSERDDCIVASSGTRLSSSICVAMSIS